MTENVALDAPVVEEVRAKVGAQQTAAFIELAVRRALDDDGAGEA